MPALALGHGVLAALLLGASLLPQEARTVCVRIAGVVGMSMGLWLASSGGPDVVWRASELLVGPTVLVGVAIACAWLLVFTLDPTSGRADVAAAIGAAAAGLALYGTSRWLVPGLLFWLVGSLGAAAAAATFQRRGEVWLQVFASGALTVAALVTAWNDTGAWEMPNGVDGAAYWLLVAAALISAGAIPRLGIWRMCGYPAAAATPLLTAGAFFLSGGPGAGTQPWLAAVLLLAAGATAIVGLRVRGLQGPWLVLLLLAASFAFPELAPTAGIAACLAVTVVALGPVRSRGVTATLAVSLMVPTIGGVATLHLTGAAFEKAISGVGGADLIAWVSVAVLAPVALLLGAGAAARNMTGASSGQSGMAVALATLTFGLFPTDLGQLPASPFGVEGAVATLFSVAILIGVGVAYLAQLGGTDGDATPEVSATSVGWEGRVSARSDVIATQGALVLLAGVVGAVAWLTYEGLKVGFL